MQRRSLLILILIYGCIASCTSTDERNLRCPPLADFEDEDKLRLIDYIPLGITYAQLESCNLGVSNIEAPDSALSTTGIATAPLPFADRLWELRFNFTKGILHSYFVHLSGIDHGTADSLYADIRKHYSKQFGKPFEQVELDEAYKYHSVTWQFPTHYVQLSKSRYPDLSYLHWGYHRPPRWGGGPP